MLICEFEKELTIPENMLSKYNMKGIAYFDIETTGFDKDKDNVILISLGYFNLKGSFTIKQYFAEDLKEEKDILASFCMDLAPFNVWCSYNGIAFDEPFIRNRMKLNLIDEQLPENHLDLYRLIRPYYKQLGMARCNLKSVEAYLGINREDTIDGGISVILYYEFLETRDDDIKQKILLHNFEDVLNLPKLFSIVYKIDTNDEIVREDVITQKQLRFLNSLLKKKELTVDFEVKKVSKKTASRLIDAILKGNTNVSELNQIASNSY